MSFGQRTAFRVRGEALIAIDPPRTESLWRPRSAYDGRVRALLLVLTACGGSDTAGNVLFEDDFSGSYPGPNWVGDGMLDPAAGAPAPALVVRPVAPLAMAVAQAANPVDVSAGVTFSFDATNVPDLASSDVNLFDVNTNTNAVYVTLRPTVVLFHIAGSPVGTVPITRDEQFHSYEVHVSASGATTWSRDGAIQLEGQLDFTPTLARIILRTDPNGFSIDNVLVVSD
jgi:hypothetical protein